MNKINGIYAASMSLFDENLSLDVDKTIEHVENLIQDGCHGVAIFGSTGQAQLIPLGEKIGLVNKLSTNKYKKNFIIGTGLNSLSENINFMKISVSLGFKNFLLMPPAYYHYKDQEVFTYYSKIVERVPDAKIILYNFEKLCGYKFSVDCVEKLVKNFPDQIVGVKDSSYNLFEKLNIENFSVFPGSESKLLKGLEIGCAGIITATCNVTAFLARKVFDDFLEKKNQTVNEKLCKVRKVFEQFNLISALHTYLLQKDLIYKNVIPTISLLDKNDKKKLYDDLDKLDFKINN